MSELPVYELERGAAQAEVENGLAKGMEHLRGEEPRKAEDHLHNTRYLLRQYRRIAYPRCYVS